MCSEIEMDAQAVRPVCFRKRFYACNVLEDILIAVYSLSGA